MTRVALLAAAATAALAAAVPADAVILPACTTRLIHAPAGASSTCSTDNTPMVSGATVNRIATAVVAEGVARVTITCGFGAGAPSRSIVVSGAEPKSVAMLEDYSPSCRTTVEAVYPNTTVNVTSTWSYVFINPGAVR